MTLMQRVGPFVGGLLVGNSAPHLATAATGRTHLTPLAGKESSAVVNLIWGLGNAVAGLALTRACANSPGRRWDGSLIAFEAGVAAFATWMAMSEAALRVNSAGGAIGERLFRGVPLRRAEAPPMTGGAAGSQASRSGLRPLVPVLSRPTRPAAHSWAARAYQASPPCPSVCDLAIPGPERSA